MSEKAFKILLVGFDQTITHKLESLLTNVQQTVPKLERDNIFTKHIDGKLSTEHHKIIQQHAEKGWRLVQIFAPSLINSGFSPVIEMIFERPVN